MHALAMSPARARTAALLVNGLARWQDRVTALAPDRWRLALPGRPRAAAHLAVDDHWLVFERALGGCRLGRRAQAQRWSWRLLDPRVPWPAGARPVLAAGDPQVRLRAELALDPRSIGDGERLGQWIAALCADLPFPARPGAGASRDPGAPPGEALPGADTAVLAARCAEAGWPAAPRGDSGDLVTELPGRDGTAAFAVVSPGGGGARARVALALDDGAGATPACRAAVGVALLRAAGAVRLVRATAALTDEGVDGALEARIAEPTEAALDDALSALALARQQVSAEIVALAGDDALAGAYLTVQGIR